VQLRGAPAVEIELFPSWREAAKKFKIRGKRGVRARRLQ
jgi:hypothetical protein